LFKLLKELSSAQTAEVEAFVSSAPSGSYLQMPSWPKACQTPDHHDYVHLLARDSQGQLIGYGLTRITPLFAGFRLATIRRGPVTNSIDQLPDICAGFARELRAAGCCTLALNPRWQGEEPVACAVRSLEGFGAAPLDLDSQPLHQATLLVDLSGDEAKLAARMKQRSRRLIRKGENMGLTVRHVETLEDARRFEPLMKEFYERRHLGMEGIPPIDELFAMTRDKGVFVIGELEGEIVCGHVAIADGDRVFWLVMASDDTKKNIPKNYSLVYEAMRAAQSQGFRWYDMAGTPPASAAQDEVSKAAINRDQFKMAFSPEYQPLVPMFVVPLRQPAHRLLFGLRQWIKARRRSPRRAARS
jgi:lipid II:glycine glycyltransferase (peptidoglycan interpeptide bridge formation enzyme)